MQVQNSAAHGIGGELKIRDLTGFRERGAATKQFATRYYNVDIHKAALASPEFMREALGD